MKQITYLFFLGTVLSSMGIQADDFSDKKEVNLTKPSYICESDGFVPPVEPALPFHLLFKSLPQTYNGTFQWEHNKMVQEAKFIWTSQVESDNGKIGLLGVAFYTVNTKKYRFPITGTVSKNHQEISIFELSSDGEHKGTISSDLKTIQTVWTMNKTGKKGFLKLTLEEK